MPRIYCPLTSQDMKDLAAQRDIAPHIAIAVTAALRALAPAADDEEQEHLATQLAAATVQDGRIIVGAFDADVHQITEVSNPQVPGQCSVKAGLALRQLACFLVADAGATVSDDAELELSWFDVSEIDLVIEEAAK